MQVRGSQPSEWDIVCGGGGSDLGMTSVELASSLGDLLGKVGKGS